jgi:hypothetical protein
MLQEFGWEENIVAKGHVEALGPKWHARKGASDVRVDRLRDARAVADVKSKSAPFAEKKIAKSAAPSSSSRSVTELWCDE